VTPWLACFGRVARALVLCLSLSGCSFLFVSGPPDNHRELPKFDCTKGRGWPVTDTVMGTIYALDLALSASGGLEEGTPPEKRLSAGANAALISTFAGLTALSAASAYYGFTRTSSCREATSALQARDGIPEPLAEGGALMVMRDGRAFLVAPGSVAMTLVTAEGEMALPLRDVTWLAGDAQKRVRLAKDRRSLAGTVKHETLHLQRITRRGREWLALPAGDVAFFLGAELNQESGTIRVEDLPGGTRVRYAYREPSALNGAFDVELFPEHWVGGVVLSRPSYRRQLASEDNFDLLLSVEGQLPAARAFVSELHLTFDRGRREVTTTNHELRPSAEGIRSDLNVHFGTPFGGPTHEIVGSGTLLVYLAEPSADALATGLVRVHRTLSNLLLLPVDVERGLSTTPPVAGAPPSASDWTSEYPGQGSLTVTVRNGSAIPVFVRVRDNQRGATAAQVSVGSNAETSVYLGSGEFDVLMRAQMDGRTRFFRGQPISVPPGATGQAVLSVGLTGGGDALHEIDAAEFAR